MVMKIGLYQRFSFVFGVVGLLLVVFGSCGVADAKADSFELPATNWNKVAVAAAFANNSSVILIDNNNSDLLLEQAGELDENAGEVVPAFGTKDSWRWSIYGAGTIDIRRDGEQYHAVFALEDFLAEDFSVNFEFAGIYFDQPVDRTQNPGDGVGFNMNLLFRWYFLSGDRWSLYADGGAGFVVISVESPIGGTNYNFTPQAGLGMSIALSEKSEGIRLITGIRWFHMSNARVKGQANNPGRDAAMFYAGLSFPF